MSVRFQSSVSSLLHVCVEVNSCAAFFRSCVKVLPVQFSDLLLIVIILFAFEVKERGQYPPVSLPLLDPRHKLV